MRSIQISVSKSKEKAAACHYKFNTITAHNLAELAEISTLNAWSPCRWRGGQRASIHYLGCDLAVLDYDDSVLLADMVERMTRSNIAHFITTTKSHQKTKRMPSGRLLPARDRFRLVMVPGKPFESTPSEYKNQITQVMTTMGCADQACKDAARFYFPGNEVVSIADGLAFLLPQVKVNKEYVKSHKKPIFIGNKCQYMHKNAVCFLRDGVTTGRGRRMTVYFVAAELGRLGYPLESTIEAINYSPWDRSGLSDGEIRDLERQIANGWRSGCKPPK